MELNTCVDPGTDSSDILNAFAQISLKIGHMLSVPSSRPRSTEPRWFDSNCSKAGRKLREALKVLPRDKQLISTRRTQYKSALAVRRNEIKEEVWKDLLDPSVLGNSVKFWGIINRPLFENQQGSEASTNITEEQWVTHYVYLFSDKRSHSTRDR